MTPEEFAELDRAFLALLEMPEERRADRLAAIEADSPERAARLRAMLDAHDTDSPSIEEAVRDAADDLTPSDDPLIGETFGAFRAVELLGRGGMGAVYLGKREEGGFRQIAAIKTVRAGMESPHVLERFSRERAILAQLDHPGIARMLDGGQGPRGIPFVVMEYVDGKPITRWVREHGCGLRERLRLFVDLCEAIDFVHRNSVIHRDIKPGNVLVTDDGTVKLLDFGIAKLADAFAWDRLTRTEQGPMTPDYASPEQILNRPITTASDVYSLGVLLYELLTEVRPFDIDSRDPYALSRLIAERTPTLPSAATSPGRPAGRRQAPAPAWRRQLRGDLDRIAMMALRKEPERRYGSAGALGEDVRRYLDGRPVSAQDDVWHYRVRKFVRRYPVPSALAVAFLLTVVGFSAFTWRQSRVVAQERDRAVAASRRAETTSEFLARLLQTADPRQRGDRNMTVMEVVENGLEELERDTELDVESRIELHMTLAFTLVNLERFEPGIRSAERALELALERHGAQSLEVAGIKHRIGDFYRKTQRYEEAWAYLNEALRIREARLSGPTYELADSYNNIAIAAMEMGRFRESEEMQRRSVELHERRVGPAAHVLGTPLNNLALCLRRKGALREALAASRRAADVVDSESEPSSALYFRQSAASTLRAMGRYDDAEHELREILEPSIRLLGESHGRILAIHRALAEFEAMRGEIDAARRRLEEVRTRTVDSRGERSLAFALWLRAVGRVERIAGDPETARDFFERSIAVHEAVGGGGHFRHGYMVVELVRVLNGLGEFGASEREARAALDRIPALEEYPLLVRAELLTARSGALRGLGRLDEARGATEEALRILDATDGRTHGPAAEALRELARVERASGNGAAADRLETEADAIVAGL